MDSVNTANGCKDVENFLQPYLEYKLEYKDCRTLLSHLRKCHECMDELEIRYLLHEGLNRLEDGQEFNLKQELEDRLYRSEQHILMMERLKTSVILFVAAGFVFIAVHLILLFIG